MVADVRLVTVDFDRECPMSRLLDAVGGGPPDEVGRLVIVLLVERLVEAIDPPAVEDGA